MSITKFFLFDHPATPKIYTLSLHDALPISDLQKGAAPQLERIRRHVVTEPQAIRAEAHFANIDLKSTRLNSSHLGISYAVFCLKKKNYIKKTTSCLAV